METAPYTLPHVQMRTHEEIEREVMMELREIDRQYGILRWDKLKDGDQVNTQIPKSH